MESLSDSAHIRTSHPPSGSHHVIDICKRDEPTSNATSTTAMAPLEASSEVAKYHTSLWIAAAIVAHLSSWTHSHWLLPTALRACTQQPQHTSYVAQHPIALRALTSTASPPLDLLPGAKRNDEYHMLRHKTGLDSEAGKESLPLIDDDPTRTRRRDVDGTLCLSVRPFLSALVVLKM